MRGVRWRGSNLFDPRYTFSRGSRPGSRRRATIPPWSNVRVAHPTESWNGPAGPISCLPTTTESLLAHGREDPRQEDRLDAQVYIAVSDVRRRQIQMAAV